jgi:hypothetical protein
MIETKNRKKNRNLITLNKKKARMKKEEERKIK